MPGIINKDDKECSVVAFDCFDTIIHRNCNNEQVLFDWAKAMSFRLNFELSPKEIYEKRKFAEIQNRKKLHVEDGSYTDLLTTLYGQLKPSINLTDFIDICVSEEISREMAACYVDNDNILLVQDAIAKGQKVIIVSDFYFGKEMLIKIFDHLHISALFSEYYISSDVGKRKSTGHLYSYVLENEKIKPSQLTMYGDNKISDVSVPSTLGIKAIHLENKSNHSNSYTSKEIKADIEKLLQETSFSLDGYAPLFLLWAEGMFVQAKKRNTKKLLFCSREGQLLEKVFNAYQDVIPENEKINTAYFYVSRKSTVIASLESFSTEKFDHVFKCLDYSIGDFLRFLQIDEKIIDEVLVEINSNKNELLAVKGSMLSNMRVKLQNNALFMKEYNRVREEQKNIFLTYINQVYGFLPTRIDMVDIGWKGSIQDNIRKIVPEDIPIYGYYLGIYDGERFERKIQTADNNVKIPIIFSNCANFSYGKNILQKNRFFLELLFSANHGSVTGYELDNGVVKPLVEQSESQTATYRKIQEYQKRLVCQYKELLYKIYNSKYSAYDLRDMLCDAHARQVYIKRPSQWNFYKAIEDTATENFIVGTHKMNVGYIIKNLPRTVHDRYFSIDMKFLEELYRIPFLRSIGWLLCRIIYAVAIVIKSRKSKRCALVG